MVRLLREIRQAIAALTRTPTATAVMVATLALAIGANSAIFSLLNAIVLRPLPVPNPEELLRLQTTSHDVANGSEPLTLPAFQELVRHQAAFSSIFAANEGNVNNLEVAGNHYTAGVSDVSGNYFSTLRVVPLLGRFISDGDVALDSGTSNAVAVISYRAWRSWFQSDPQVLGKTIHVGIHPFTVIGVEPEEFHGLIIDGSPDVFIPLFAPGTYMSRDPKMLWLDVYGRLRPGVTLAQAQAQLQTLWPSILRATVPPDYEGARSQRFFARKLKVESAAQGTSYLRTRFAHPLSVLLALVATLLLIACLNLANLTVAKMANRQHEWSIKLALGAGSWDLVRPILIESLFISFLGALLGLGIALWAGRAFLHIAWRGVVDPAINAAPDGRVMLFTMGVAILAALVFAMVPLSYALRTKAGSGLRENNRSVHIGSTLLGRSLLTAQIALSLLLVAGALLFGKTLLRLQTVDTGYRRDHLLTLLLFPQASSSRRVENRSAYYRQLSEKVKAIPGVLSVSYAGSAPAGGFEAFEPMRLRPDSETIQTIDEVVGPEFFKTVGMHVLSGRDFDWSDDEHAIQAAVVSQSFAKRLFGNADPVGRDFYWGVVSNLKKLRVVGVVNDARLWKVDGTSLMAVYRPFLQDPDSDEPLLDLRTLSDPGSFKAPLERVIRDMGHHYSLRTMTVEERLSYASTVQRLTSLLTSFFGFVALMIAAIGLYGLISFQVTQRTKEMGVRFALGAQSAQVLNMVLREAVAIAVVGSVIGLLATVALRSYVASILFATSATDPVLLGLAALTLISASLLAGFLPARRASLVDPAVALRNQ